MPTKGSRGNDVRQVRTTVLTNSEDGVELQSRVKFLPQCYRQSGEDVCLSPRQLTTLFLLLMCYFGQMPRAAAQTCPPKNCACYNPATTPLSGNGYTEVDKSIISKHEGGDFRTAYPPPSSRSGVTIGIGVDLGQQTATGLTNMGVSQGLVDVLMPYLGMTDGTASQYLASHPLTLTQPQDDELNSHVMPSYFSGLGTAYDNAASNSDYWPLSDMPWQAQTVLADLWYNMGDLRHAAPNFWNEMRSGDWDAAYNNLMNFTSNPGDALYKRAQSDAALLKQAMDIGSLPAMQPCP